MSLFARELPPTAGLPLQARAVLTRGGARRDSRAPPLGPNPPPPQVYRLTIQPFITCASSS